MLTGAVSRTCKRHDPLFVLDQDNGAEGKAQAKAEREVEGRRMHVYEGKGEEG